MYLFIYQNTITRSEEQTLRNIGKTMTLQRKKNRAKRINLNVKINAVAYLVEVIGGLVVFSLAFLPTLTPTIGSNGYVYITIQVLYGNVIPSCYLMNNSNFKSIVMDNGWIAAMSTVYSKIQAPQRAPQEQQPVISRKNRSAQNHAENAITATKKSPLKVATKKIICKGETTNEIQGTNQQIQETAPNMDTTFYSNDTVTQHDLPRDTIKSCADHENGSDNSFQGRETKSQISYLSRSISHCIAFDGIEMSSVQTKSLNTGLCQMSMSKELEANPSVLLPNQVEYH